jgi:hypothetical protein
MKIYRLLAIQENFRMRSVFVYNLAYYPAMIIMIYSFRGLLSFDDVNCTGFLYLDVNILL